MQTFPTSASSAKSNANRNKRNKGKSEAQGDRIESDEAADDQTIPFVARERARVKSRNSDEKELDDSHAAGVSKRTKQAGKPQGRSLTADTRPVDAEAVPILEAPGKVITPQDHVTAPTVTAQSPSAQLLSLEHSGSFGMTAISDAPPGDDVIRSNPSGPAAFDNGLFSVIASAKSSLDPDATGNDTGQRAGQESDELNKDSDIEMMDVF